MPEKKKTEKQEKELEKNDFVLPMKLFMKENFKPKIGKEAVLIMQDDKKVKAKITKIQAEKVFLNKVK